jgi:hypothetical protein
MMTRFQDVRGRLESVTRDALHAAGIITVTYDNVEETPDELPSATISLSFTDTIAHNMGCDAEFIRGTMIVTVATPKQLGSVAGEDACQGVIQAWRGLNADYRDLLRVRTRNLMGPVTIVSAAPRHIHTMNCAFRAAVFTPAPRPLIGSVVVDGVVVTP